MSKIDLLLRGGTVVLGEDEPPAALDIAIGDGRIAALLAPGTPIDAAETVSLDGLHVLPGAIDAHLHLGHGADISRPREPADAAAETAAAARGGVTTLIPYLLSAEPYETVFDDVRAVTEAGARIDFGYHFIISTEAQLAGVPRYIHELGSPTAKFFMNIRGNEGDRLGLPAIDDGKLFRLCETLADEGGMLCPHPENIEIAWVLRDRVSGQPGTGPDALALWNATRPPFVEAEAVQRAALICRATGAPLYVVHTSSAEAFEAAQLQREAGGRIFVETCPHYLTHDIDSPIGTVGKINPPLREAQDRQILWDGLADGDIDTIGTDHVHRTIAAKDGGIWKASPGCPGLDTLLPVLLSEGYHRRDLPLGRIARLTAGAPAELMGLADRKGAIRPGLDADLAVVDLDAAWTVDKRALSTGAGYSIYEGWKLRGRVVHTVSRGAFVLRDGAVVDGTEGRGRYLHRRLEWHDAAG